MKRKLVPPAKEESGAEHMRTFFRELKELHAEPFLLANEAETVAVLREIFSKIGCKSVVLAGLPPQVRSLARSASEGISCHEVEQLRGSEAARTIAQANAGITWAEYGVADRGAVLEVVYDDAVKLASCLPLNHIVVLSSKKMLAGLAEAMVEAGKIIHSSPESRKPVISFISGPSKTGDIEMQLLYGVHGPNALYVLALGWL